MMNLIAHSTGRGRPLAGLLLGLLAIAFAASVTWVSADMGGGVEQSPPGSVGSVSVTRADGSLTASWSAPAGATKYHITYSSDGKRTWSLAAAEHGSTSITISGVKNESSYVVGVRAGNAHGWSGWRNSASARPYTPPPTLTPPTTPPGTPAAVHVSRSDGAMAARWDAPTGATRYHITYSSNGGGSWTLAAYGHATNSIAISGVENGATYVVGVRAGNQHGWSGWRNSPASTAYEPPVPPTPAPTGLTAGGGPQSVTLKWDHPIDIEIHGYQYQYREASASDWGAWTDTPKSEPNIVSYTISGLTNGTEYRFRLRALGSSGPSPSAPTTAPGYVSATPIDGFSIPTPAPSLQPPETPASVTLSRASGTLTADWPDVERATSYHVTYSADGGASWNLAAIGHTVSQITISSVADMTTYIVAVRGRNDSGWGQWRNSAPLPTHLVPTNLTFTSNSVVLDVTYTFYWDKPSGASAADAFSYEIECNSNSSTDWSSTICPDDLASTANQHNSSAVTYNLLSDSLHEIRIRAVKDGAHSPWVHFFPRPVTLTSIGAQYHDGALKVWWDRHANQQGEAGYDVQCTASASTPYTWTDCHSEPASLTATFYVSPTASGTVTNVRLRAREGHRVSLWSAVTSVPSGAPPVAPGNLAVSVTTQGTTVSYALSWDKPSTPTGAVAYVVHCSDDNQTTWTQCATVAETTNANLTATPTRTTAQTGYTHFRVRADQGHLRGAWSGISTNTN